MASLTKKIIRGKPYYYLRESQRVNGKPKIVSTIYLGPPQRLLDRLLRPEPAKVALAEFGASAAVFALAQALSGLRAEGVTTVVITHRPSLIAHVDKILMLEAGRVQQFGPAAEVMKAAQRQAQVVVGGRAP